MTTVIMTNFGKVIINQITSLTFLPYKNTKFGKYNKKFEFHRNRGIKLIVVLETGFVN